MNWLTETLIAHPVFSLPILGVAVAVVSFLTFRQLALGFRMFQRKRVLLQELVGAVVHPRKQRARA
ncbi:MAG TPA: hypothetical protein EYG15_07270 [Deltaproteobacteria bacterium]|jgi:hypothetical protein|nr:hypothetical protein [Deltaproteobacteria bacterium]